MCGIAGMVRFAGLRPDETGVGAVMAATLRHRGPDDAGAYHDAWASIGHTRLSILDLGGGRQPISNEDGSVWVSFNGEIYNHVALADGLRARGHQLRTRCDSEVLSHLYEEYGDGFVERLNGMFAIALWDARRHRLLLVRDRLGLKPLYWHDDGRRVVFGSELKALLAAGDVPQAIDPCALSDYLTFGHVPAPRTIFRSIRKLEPGQLVICTAAGVQLRQYWDIPLDEESSERAGKRSSLITHHSSLVEAFAALLEDATALRMVADVPVGAFLSGGVDSAAVTAAMRRACGPSGRVLTHTVGFEEDDHDERAPARAVAGLLGTDHREVVVRPDAAWAARHLAEHFDEPFADSSAVPTYYLSKVARERVTVALAGDGGDELLGGYRRYRFDLAEQAVRARCPGWLRSAAGLAGRLYPKGDWLPRPLRARATLQNLACDEVTAHLRSVALLAGTLPDRLLRPEVCGVLGEYSPFTRGRDLLARRPRAGLLERLLYLDLKTLLPDDMLTKVDRASMAVGLEVREPLLDYRLVELAARMPPEMRLGKRVLRRVLAGWTDESIAGRQKKGFNVPVDAWFRGPLREMAGDLLLSAGTRCTEWIEPQAIRAIVRQHRLGLRRNGHVLWALLALELWARTLGAQSDRTRNHAKPTEPAAPARNPRLARLALACASGSARGHQHRPEGCA